MDDRSNKGLKRSKSFSKSRIIITTEGIYIYIRAHLLKTMSAILDMVCASQRSRVLGVKAVLIEF